MCERCGVKTRAHNTHPVIAVHLDEWHVVVLLAAFLLHRRGRRSLQRHRLSRQICERAFCLARATPSTDFRHLHKRRATVHGCGPPAHAPCRCWRRTTANRLILTTSSFSPSFTLPLPRRGPPPPPLPGTLKLSLKLGCVWDTQRGIETSSSSLGLRPFE